MATLINLGNVANTLTPIPADADYIIIGVDGSNTLTLGAGNDQLTLGNGNNTLTLGGGTDQIMAGTGNNTVTTTGSGADTITLTDGNNTVVVGSGPDVILATDGLNTVTAGDGNDTIRLGNGVDHVTTGNGNSLITVGNGNGDTITAGTGSNTIALGTGNADVVHTGSGNNTVTVTALAASTDTIMGGLSSLNGSQNLLTLTTAGTINAGGVSGFEIYRLANGGLNSLILTDANFARLPSGSITVEGGDTGSTVDASGLSAAHAVVLHASPGINLLTGGAADDTFFGASGTSTVNGGAGVNTMIFPGPQSSYSVQVVGLVTHVVGPNNVDDLTNIQQIRFTEPPPTALVLDPASDSGISNTDRITNVTLPIITGIGTDGDTVTLFDSATAIGTGTVAGGVWSITASTALTEGTNAITATQTNAAADVSGVSSPLTVVLDTQAPIAPTSLALDPASDSGISNTDRITNVTLPIITGIGTDGDTVTLFDGATAIGTGTVAGGVWSITASTALTVGANAITATQTNAAGNVSVPSSTLNMTIDTAQISFITLDTTTSVTTTSAGDTYTGPVAGLQHEYVDITTDNLNITSLVPNAFIHSASGLDGIDVSHANGNNILDGGGGSSFLTGGTGNDTFYLDNRSPQTSPVFSTIVNFHTGDNATVWGINATDFTMLKLDNQGATGFKGLDFISSAPGHVDTSFVLAGYTSADLTNGRLSQSYGTTPNLPGLPGSQYLTIHAN